MRILKFRAWHKTNKAFIYATLKDFWKNGWIICESTVSETPKQKLNPWLTAEEYLDKSEGFMVTADWKQYIGLKDKKGNEIYEGDILLCSDTTNNPPPRFLEVREIDPTRDYNWIGFWDHYEVVGNIYENSELLSEEK